MFLLSDYAELVQEIIGRHNENVGINVYWYPPSAINMMHSVGFRESIWLVQLWAVSWRWRKQDSIEVGILLDEPKPSGKPDLSVVGVPGFPGLVSGSSASMGVHYRRSLIINSGSVNRDIQSAEAQHPISTIGHNPRSRPIEERCSRNKHRSLCRPSTRMSGVQPTKKFSGLSSRST
jgi:hypothetical protein